MTRRCPLRALKRTRSTSPGRICPFTSAGNASGVGGVEFLLVVFGERADLEAQRVGQPGGRDEPELAVARRRVRINHQLDDHPLGDGVLGRLLPVGIEELPGHQLEVRVAEIIQAVQQRIVGQPHRRSRVAVGRRLRGDRRERRNASGGSRRAFAGVPASAAGSAASKRPMYRMPATRTPSPETQTPVMFRRFWPPTVTEKMSPARPPAG